MLDWHLPYVSGEGVGGVIRSVGREIKILAVSGILTAAPEWADGWVHKSEWDRIPDAIRALASA